MPPLLYDSLTQFENNSNYLSKFSPHGIICTILLLRKREKYIEALIVHYRKIVALCTGIAQQFTYSIYYRKKHSPIGDDRISCFLLFLNELQNIAGGGDFEDSLCISVNEISLNSYLNGDGKTQSI